MRKSILIPLAGSTLLLFLCGLFIQPTQAVMVDSVPMRNTRMPSEYPTYAPPTITPTPLPSLPSDVFAPATITWEGMEDTEAVIRVQLTNSSSSTQVVHLELSQQNQQFVLAAVPQISFPASKVDPLLVRALAEEGARPQSTYESRPAITAVVLFQQPDLSAAYSIHDWEKRGQYVYDVLQRARAVQQPVLAVLATLKKNGSITSFRSFYGVNAIFVEGVSVGAISVLEEYMEVQYIELATDMYIPPLEPVAYADGLPVVQGEWGILHSRAPEVWSQFGTGKGAIVGILDTGVDSTHQALLPSYRGSIVGDEYAWLDLTGTCKKPCDDIGHGTHIMGTITGTSPRSAIGMAPGATWMAARICDTLCFSSDIMLAAEWMLAPYRGGRENPQDARPALRPHVINNSWSGNSRYWFDALLIAWQASGIVPVASAGNTGPHYSSVGYPADSPYAIGVGSISPSGTVSSFSGRGPGITVANKPDLVAAGEGVYSASPGNMYSFKSGTSMAAPHVVGCVALAVSMGIRTGDIADTLRTNARPYGQGGYNPDTGYGALDCYNAIDTSLSWIWIDLQNKQISMLPGETRVVEIHIRASRAQVGLNKANLQVWAAADGTVDNVQTVPIQILVKKWHRQFMPQVAVP